MPAALRLLARRVVGTVRSTVVGTVVGLVALGAVGGASLLLGTATATSASAAPVCETSSVPDAIRTARAVFTGTVTARSVQDVGADPRRTFLHQVELDRVYKGGFSASATEVRTERAAYQCGLGPLSIGEQYVFFVRRSGDAEIWYAAGRQGTRIANDQVVDAVVAVLGDGREPVRPTPERAEFTDAEPEAVAPLTRVAAPGIALVLVGVLGLGLFSALGRRGDQR